MSETTVPVSGFTLFCRNQENRDALFFVENSILLIPHVSTSSICLTLKILPSTYLSWYMLGIYFNTNVRPNHSNFLKYGFRDSRL